MNDCNNVIGLKELQLNPDYFFLVSNHWNSNDITKTYKCFLLAFIKVTEKRKGNKSYLN